MSKTVDVIAVTGLQQKTRKSRWPARLDTLQSASGLFLGLFMWGHMAFVSTILISEDAMWWVTRMFEGQFVLGNRYPGIVASIVAVVALMFVLHGLLAMRKLPANFQQFRNFRDHRKTLHHEDTTLWWMQAVTGIVLAGEIDFAALLLHPRLDGHHLTVRDRPGPDLLRERLREPERILDARPDVWRDLSGSAAGDRGTLSSILSQLGSR
jgi:succinate dehydrogenase/fumarate reductase cytochrome b subunit